MRKLRHWGSWAVLLLALGAAGASAAPPPADDDDDAKPAQPAGPDPSSRPRDGWNPFLSKLFGSNSPKPDPKADKDKKDKDADPKHDEPAPRISTLRERADHILELETAKLFRRQAVAQRLREIAYETGDDELERKAFQLDELASQVFKERTGRLTDMMERAERVAPSSSDRTERVREAKP